MTAPAVIDDATLARGVAAGDTSCLAAIYDRYSGPLFGFCQNMLRRPSDAAHRVGALAVGALVAAPYAMCYDATLLAPAAAAMAIAAIGRGRPAVALFALAAAYEVTQASLGLPALLAFASVVIVDRRLGPARDASATMAASGALP